MNDPNKMLNTKGPETDPWGTPKLMTEHLPWIGFLLKKDTKHL